MIDIINTVSSSQRLRLFLKNQTQSVFAIDKSKKQSSLITKKNKSLKRGHGKPKKKR